MTGVLEGAWRWRFDKFESFRGLVELKETDLKGSMTLLIKSSFMPPFSIMLSHLQISPPNQIIAEGIHRCESWTLTVQMCWPAHIFSKNESAES